MKADGLAWDYQPIENPDWDYARNMFTVLKRPQATWSQSVFSVRHENLIAPNRDYRCQGLCCFADKEYFKFMDAIFFGIRGVRLEPKKVIATPWKHVYQYSGNGVDVDVSYFLSRDVKEGISGKVIFDIKNPFLKELVIKPLIDIRRIDSVSSPEQIVVKAKDDCLVAKNGKNKISFFVNKSSVMAKKDETDWRYKTGSGFRENADNGVRFISEHARPVFAGEMHKAIKGRERVSLLINCNRKNVDFDENEERERVNRIAKKFDCKKEVMTRIISLDNFGVHENGLTIPEAGDFWFRQVWLRDLLEASINNFETFSKLDDRKIPEIIRWTLKKQDHKTGMFANFNNNYDSVDSGLLFFILAEKYMESSSDKTLENKIAQSFDLTLKRFEENKMEGCLPSIKDHLLHCLPWHSWTDSRINFNGRMVSMRIPLEWSDKPDRMVLLPEINAMFIRFLKFGETIGRDVGDLYKKAVEKYKNVFIANDFLYSVVMDERKDATESSMALVSTVLLHGHVFGKKDMERMWPSVERLLVRRDGKAFGMLCRNTGDRIYYNDCQYHGSVVWPRDTPYLIKYLKIIGKKDVVKEILESNLEHQMGEGAIFYCNELFSLPEGRNPSPTENHSNPVPVKNPIQLWSNFCDDYIRD